MKQITINLSYMVNFLISYGFLDKTLGCQNTRKTYHEIFDKKKAAPKSGLSQTVTQLMSSVKTYQVRQQLLGTVYQSQYQARQRQ